MKKEKPYLTYYVAECMEFTSLGEYYEDLSLKAAINIFEDLVSRNSRKRPGIGFILYQKGSDIDDKIEFPILDKFIDVDAINNIPIFRDSVLVQEAINAVKESFPEVQVRDRNMKSKNKQIFDDSMLRKIKDKVINNQQVIER